MQVVARSIKIESYCSPNVRMPMRILLSVGLEAHLYRGNPICQIKEIRDDTFLGDELFKFWGHASPDEYWPPSVDPRRIFDLDEWRNGTIFNISNSQPGLFRWRSKLVCSPNDLQFRINEVLAEIKKVFTHAYFTVANSSDVVYVVH